MHTQPLRELVANTDSTFITLCQRKSLSFRHSEHHQQDKIFAPNTSYIDHRKRNLSEFLLSINIDACSHTYNISSHLLHAHSHIHGDLFSQTLFQLTFYEHSLTLLRISFLFHLIVTIVVIKLYSSCEILSFYSSF